ncbi:hypothetical protein PHMEG_00015005, partial [Phytophthora megakarya]
FERQVFLVQTSRAFLWPEEVKIDLLGNYVSGKTKRYYNRQVAVWASQTSTLRNVLVDHGMVNSKGKAVTNVIMAALEKEAAESCEMAPDEQWAGLVEFHPRNKAATAKQFEHALVISEKLFDCKAPEEASLDFGSGKEVADPCKHGVVPNAYVKADKEAELGFLTRLPQGFEISEEKLKKLGVTSEEEQVLELQEALFRLKQAGRLWSKILQQKPHDAGFRQSLTDMCVYYRWDEGLYSW